MAMNDMMFGEKNKDKKFPPEKRKKALKPADSIGVMIAFDKANKASGDKPMDKMDKAEKPEDMNEMSEEKPEVKAEASDVVSRAKDKVQELIDAGDDSPGLREVLDILSESNSEPSSEINPPENEEY